MPMPQLETVELADNALDTVEQCLTSADWVCERIEEGSLHCAAPTRWGECGGVFIWRDEPASLHFNLSAEMRAPDGRHMAILELVEMINERLWLGHFEYWRQDGVIMFRHTFPMLDRDGPEPGEIVSLVTAATDAMDRFLPAFNFVVWAGKKPEEAIEATLFETAGEA